MLRQSSIRDTQDLLIKTPGVFLAGSGGRENTNLSIRGQSKALQGNSAAAVIRYFAEVPSPTVGSSLPPFDLGSAPGVKAYQSTMLARKPPGVAIPYSSTAPHNKLDSYTIVAYVQ